LLFVTAKFDPMDGKAQIGLIWWISLLFGKVKLVSGTNKAWSKIL
jgi:hypothetical protein